MTADHPAPRTWKGRLKHEAMDYWFTFVYLAVLFEVFAWHRRLIMDEANIPIADVWTPLIEAAVLAKVILIIDLFGVSHRFESRPLIVSTLYKTGFFAVCIVLFNVCEATVKGLFTHHGALYGFEEFMRMNRFELLSRVLTKSFALIPFFAFREVGRVLGEGTMASLFLSNRRPNTIAVESQESGQELPK